MQSNLMPCLSIRQPWAWAILHLGKDVENRSWPTKHRGPILIHAGKWFRLEDVRKEFFLFMARQEKFGTPESDAKIFTEMRTQTGGIVGVVTIVDCVRGYASPWAIPGQWHWVLADPKPLPFFPCKGRLGIFKVEYPFTEVAA